MCHSAIRWHGAASIWLSDMKRCFKCLCEKPLEAFYRHAMMADGHLNKCVECAKADVLKHRQENLEKVRSYDRMRASQPHRLASRTKYTELYRKEYPNRAKANAMVTRAVRAGLLKKQPCWECGAEKVVAHHPNYDAPLDVVWLCQGHHKQAHALVANEGDYEKSA
jgi:hypothetical protein